MRRIRNLLAGCLTIVAGLTSSAAVAADLPTDGVIADAEIEQVGLLSGCGDASSCDADCVADPCLMPADCIAPTCCDGYIGGCAADASFGVGCGAPCGLGCEAPGGCGLCGGCEAPCGGGLCGGCAAPGCCDGGCAAYGRGGWWEMQKRTMKYGWNGEAGTLCGGCNGQCGQCGGCGAAGGWLGYKMRCIFGVSGGVTHSPGHGYVLPMKRPIYDVAHPYSHMWAAHPITGAAHTSSTPYRNVYMPTDTTQLGYSYGPVPYWMPRGGMVPAVPIPDAYHNRINVEDRCGDTYCEYEGDPSPTLAEGTDATRTATVPPLTKIPQ